MTTPRITRLLQEWSTGDEDALNTLMPLVHRELQLLARRHMRGERQGHTLQATALVSETYLRLVELKRIDWKDREHFFAVAARVMRRVLVDAARARAAQKRGEGVRPASLEDVELADHPGAENLLLLDDALRKLQAVDGRKARVVELKVFAGLRIEEVATTLGVSAETIKRDWRLAKAWLARELTPSAHAGGGPPRT
jgi:RNA polymerase sigma factor (TIGR02999 family)